MPSFCLKLLQLQTLQSMMVTQVYMGCSSAFSRAPSTSHTIS
jgi:hypothetical protein